MPDRRRRNCQTCGKHDSEVGPISWGGNCITCADALLEENIRGLHAMEGHVRDRWARGMILSAGGLLPERLETRSA